MGKITTVIEIIGANKSRKIDARLDTGASYNYLPTMFKDGDRAENLGFREFRGTHDFRLADETLKKGDIVQFDMLKIGKTWVKDPIFIIFDNLVDDAIIGTHVMQFLGLKIDMKQDKVIYRK